jgi:hypothetical protein
MGTFVYQKRSVKPRLTELLEYDVESSCDTLRSALSAINGWSKNSHRALYARIERVAASHGGKLPAHADFTDEVFDLQAVKQAMFGGLCAAIAATGYSYWKLFQSDQQKKGAGEKDCERNFAKIDEHSCWNRIRILANSLKHDDGRAGKDFVKTYPGELQSGEEIDFTKENWSAHIDRLEQFLHNVVEESSATTYELGFAEFFSSFKR